MAFLDDNSVEDLDRFRSTLIGLAVFLIGVGAYLVDTDPLGGIGMIFGGILSGAMAIYVHRLYKSKSDVKNIRKKLGYD